jgi:hypothetical protein
VNVGETGVVVIANKTGRTGHLVMSTLLLTGHGALPLDGTGRPDRAAHPSHARALTPGAVRRCLAETGAKDSEAQAGAIAGRGRTGIERALVQRQWIEEEVTI